MNWILRLAAIIISICLTCISHIYIYRRGVEKEDVTVRKLKTYLFSPKIIVTSIICIFLSILLFYMSDYYGHTIMESYKCLIVFLWMVPIALIDKKEQAIPNILSLFGLGFWSCLLLLEWQIAKVPLKTSLLFSLFGMLLGGGVFLICALILKGSVGMGDVKLFSLLGMFYGFTGLFSILFVSLILLGIVSIFLLIVKKADKKSVLPMAPFALIGFIISIMLGV